jgi:endonuclease/exonuclease/phosphatase family metal-dependent hydrolase
MSKCKKILFSVLAVLLTLILAACAVFFWYWPRYLERKPILDIRPPEDRIRIMSANLRCLTPLDLGKTSWFYRADLMAAEIAQQAPGIIGFQEATRWQYRYLVQAMPAYDSVIDYRDDTLLSEGCPIFYSKELYALKDKGSFWLSETPEVMSKDWGAACFRICSYVILTEKSTGKDFVVFNTHLDHVSDEARIKGMAVVLDRIAKFGGIPAVLMGDLNAEEDSETILDATEHFLDARYAAPETEDSYTYQNWGNMEKAVRIDYFMISKEGITPIRYDVLTETHDGAYSSDHCPILLELRLN